MLNNNFKMKKEKLISDTSGIKADSFENIRITILMTFLSGHPNMA